MKKQARKLAAIAAAAVIAACGSFVANSNVTAVKADGEVEVSVGQVSGAKGASVEVPVTIANNPGLSDVSLTFNYSTDLTLRDTKTGSGMTVDSLTNLENKRVLLTNATQAGYTGTLLVTLVFDVSGTAEVGRKSIEITNGEFSDKDANMISGIQYSAGYIDVAEASITGTASITGAAKYDQTLTASLSGGPSGAALTYAWYRGADPISGAAAATYKLVAADIGKVIKVEIGAAGYSGTKSETTAAVAKADKPAAPAAPAAGAVTTTGVQLNATAGYEYRRGTDAATINTTGTFSGLTAGTDYSFYQRAAEIKVGSIVVRDASEWSPAAAITTSQDDLTGSVTISGSAVFDETLTAVPAGLNAGAVALYQWYRGEDVISGATSVTYKLAAADVGKAVKVRVTATGFGGYAESAATATVAKAAAATPAAPTVAGKTSVAVTLTPHSGYEYAIGDAKTQTNTTGEFTGLTIDTSYNFYQRSLASDTHTISEWSAALTASTSGLAGSVAITGEQRYGGTLTAELTGFGELLEPVYSWLRDGAVIAGASGDTYALTADDIGKVITASVSAEGKIGELTASTAAIAKAAGPAKPAAPAVSSKTADSVKLTAVSGQEYRVNGGAPNATGEFTGLNASTTYKFETRVKETATHEASGWSDELSAATDAAAATGTPGSGGNPAPAGPYTPVPTVAAPSPAPGADAKESAPANAESAPQTGTEDGAAPKGEDASQGGSSGGITEDGGVSDSSSKDGGNGAAGEAGTTEKGAAVPRFSPKNLPTAADVPEPSFVKDNGIAAVSNGITYLTIEQDGGLVLIFDGNGTALGYVILKAGQTLDDIDIVLSIVPIGKGKSNPGTGDGTAPLLPIASVFVLGGAAFAAVLSAKRKSN